MTVNDEIIVARTCGVVRCGLSSKHSSSVAELAQEFGLFSDPANFKEIDTAAARRLAELILNQDMAYNSEIMPLDRAIELADRFLAQFGAEDVRYFTNGTFHEERGPKLARSSVQWNPVTESTFDTGILITSPRCCGCLWVEDED